MDNKKRTSRQRILAAAAEVANEAGAGNLSLDAVALRAGVSKGGLLYNFPTKAKLLQGLVENYIANFEQALAAATDASRGDTTTLLAAYVTLSAEECRSMAKPPSGLLAAMAEDPDFMRPAKAHKRSLLDRLMTGTPDAARVLNAFLVVEGLRSLKLLDMDILTEAEMELVLSELLAEAGTADRVSSGDLAAV